MPAWNSVFKNIFLKSSKIKTFLVSKSWANSSLPKWWAVPTCPVLWELVGCWLTSRLQKVASGQKEQGLNVPLQKGSPGCKGLRVKSTLSGVKSLIRIQSGRRLWPVTNRNWPRSCLGGRSLPAQLKTSFPTITLFGFLKIKFLQHEDFSKTVNCS